jgi:hypothetical protein
MSLASNVKVTTTSKSDQSYLHDSACTLAANFNPKWILLNENIIESSFRSARGGQGNVQRDWDFIPVVVWIINLCQMKVILSGIESICILLFYYTEGGCN